MYETKDACNIKPIMPAESRQKLDVSLFGKQIYDASFCFEFSGNKGLGAVRSEKEPQLITSGQHFGNQSNKIQDYPVSNSNSLSSNSFNSTSIQCQPEFHYYPIDANNAKINNNYYNYNNCYSTPNTNNEQCYNNNYNFNEVLAFNNNGLSNCIDSLEIKNDNLFNYNAGQEDEFESVINPRSKLEPQPGKAVSLPSSSYPLFIEPFSCYSQQNPDINPQLQAKSEMTTMMIPSFPLDFVSSYNYLSQDTDDAFASVIYNTTPQLKPVICSTNQAQSTISQFYTYNNNIYSSNINSCCATDITKQNNTYTQASSFTPFISSEKDKTFQPTSQYDNCHADQLQSQNRNFCLNSPSTKHRQRVSSNEYKRYRSPATLIIQFPTSSKANGPESQALADKNSSGSSISVSSEKRARTRKVSSSPSLGKPPRNNFTDIDIIIDDKKPVINFQKPTISSSSNSEKNNNQNENRKYESTAKTKIRGRK